jgi:hypothetical protein
MVSILFYAVNEDNNHNSTIYDTKNSKPVLIVKDSNSLLSESIPSSSIIDIADTVIKKDERLELVPKNCSHEPIVFSWFIVLQLNDSNFHNEPLKLSWIESVHNTNSWWTLIESFHKLKRSSNPFSYIDI